MDLFDFIETKPKSETDILDHFQILKQTFKNKRNIWGIRKSDLPNEVIPYLLDFEERKWIKFYSGDRSGVSLKHDLRDWHTPDEAIESIVEEAEEAYLNGNYQKALGCRWHPHFEFATRDLQFQFWELNKKAFDSFAQRLVQEQKALDYFMNNEEVRGSKISRFSEKLEKAVIKVASEEISLIKDYNEMKSYFEKHAFFCGLPTHSYRPEIKVIIPTRLVLAALCEATELKDISLILTYTGGTWTNLNGNYTIVYPPGWDFFRVFEETSTPEAMSVIASEIERLNRLNNHKSQLAI
ncbi:hypothetical protein [Robertmurraya massiliosenegalensis]|uniref:hypothetical protein n=1 Tax=Robertmurraya massiliosenegalensis TaxID=1287657 RepID=UPI0002DE961F|nr:hypothetical protein [Robertmurraya massiliosenegalensis]